MPFFHCSAGDADHLADLIAGRRLFCHPTTEREPHRGVPAWQSSLQAEPCRLPRGYSPIVFQLHSSQEPSRPTSRCFIIVFPRAKRRHGEPVLAQHCCGNALHDLGIFFRSGKKAKVRVGVHVDKPRTGEPALPGQKTEMPPRRAFLSPERSYRLIFPSSALNHGAPVPSKPAVP